MIEYLKSDTLSSGISELFKRKKEQNVTEFDSYRKEISTVIAGICIGFCYPMVDLSLKSGASLTPFSKEVLLGDKIKIANVLLDWINEETLINIPRAKAVAMSVWDTRLTAAYPGSGSLFNLMEYGFNYANYFIDLPPDIMNELGNNVIADVVADVVGAVRSAARTALENG